MNTRETALAVLTAFFLVTLVLAGCTKEPDEKQATPREDPATAGNDSVGAVSRSGSGFSPVEPGGLPRLVDLGKGTCIPCKMMAPILEEIKREYEGMAVVEVIDLREEPAAGDEYGIRLIPTQIFFDAAGREVWRHEGFLGKDAIVAKLAEMGVEPLDN